MVATVSLARPAGAIREMAIFRKKPIVVEADQYLDGMSVEGVCCNMACPYLTAHVHTIHDGQFTPIADGDWIIAEPDGEHYYPCKPDIFEATYEPVEQPKKREGD